MGKGSIEDSGTNLAKKVKNIAVDAVREEVAFHDVGMVLDCPIHKEQREQGKVCCTIKDSTDPSENSDNDIILHDVPVNVDWAGEIKTNENDFTGSGVTRTFPAGSQVSINYRQGNFNAPYVSGFFYNPHEKTINENQPAVAKLPLDKDYWATRLAGGKIGMNEKGRIDLKTVGKDGQKPAVGVVIDPDEQTVSIGGEEKYLKYEEFEKESGLEKRPDEEKTTLKIDAKNNKIEIITTHGRTILIDDKSGSISIINSKDKEEINSIVIKESEIKMSYAEGEPELTMKKNGDLDFKGKNVTFTCDKFNVKPNKGTGIVLLEHDITKMNSTKTFLHSSAVMANNVVTAKDPVPGYGAPTAGVAKPSGAFA